MKKTIILLHLISLLLFACHKEDPSPIPSPPLDSTKGILPSSSEYLSPYHGKDRVVFEDSLGNELWFQIKTNYDARLYGIAFFYDNPSPGDTLQYPFDYTGERITLMEDSSRYYFSIELFPALYTPQSNPSQIKGKDHLFIFLQQPSSSNHTYSIYQKVVDFRDCAEEDKWESNILEPSRSFLGVTFQQVEHTNYTSPKALAYYNAKDGIVAFSDYDHKLWRLKI